MSDKSEQTKTEVPISEPKCIKEKPLKRKKGKVFSTPESMLAIIDQVVGKQETQVKQKLDRQVSRENFLIAKKQKIEEKKSRKVNKLEEVKKKLKKETKAPMKVSKFDKKKKADRSTSQS
ncbi:hypothetical protein DSO57_1032917 [Entomophthora muscae]|uniref:Uncharacterized protein n=1 Tax=Entomophthora muscae TaxID=34485 RepID=A0ACC2SQ07_9FUNG|nr:hypothetical protein DSO57_1032917 [Entomophthora muscae]